MSYDIYALRVPHGEANAEALESILARETATDAATPLDPAKEARKKSIAAALATRGGFEVIEHDYADLADEHDTTEEEVRRRMRHVRCDNGTVLIEVEDEHAVVKAPYSSSLAADEVADDVFKALRILDEEAHLVPYDPQVGRELELDRDRGAFLDSYREGVEKARRTGAEEPVTERPRPPWWKRLLSPGRGRARA